MVHRLAALCLAALVLGVLPAAASHESPTACDDDRGRELLTRDGWGVSFDAPAVTAPNYGYPPANHPFVTALRSAHFYLHADISPFAEAHVTLVLDWDLPSDYDIFVYDASGREIAASLDENLTDDTLREEATLSVRDCQSIRVNVRSWAGTPSQTLRLTATVTQLAGLTDKPPLDRSRRLLYLDGSPGQVAMLGGDPVNGSLPAESAMTPDRATSGVPNQFTRLGAGLCHDGTCVGQNSYRNATQAHFTHHLGSPRLVRGDVTVQLWLSSTTMRELDGLMSVRLYGDGEELRHPAQIQTSEVESFPRLHQVSFEGIDRVVASSLTVQVGASPILPPDASHVRPGQTTFTLWYGSVQFPSRVVLP